MGLSYDDVQDLRSRYPDRLQTASKIADYDFEKQFLVKMYAASATYAVVFGFFPLTTNMLLSNLKKGAHYRSSVSIFAPSHRRATMLYLANLGLGSALSAYCYWSHTQIEKEAAGVWAVQAAHLSDYKPKGPQFLDRYACDTTPPTVHTAHRSPLSCLPLPGTFRGATLTCTPLSLTVSRLSRFGVPTTRPNPEGNRALQTPMPLELLVRQLKWSNGHR